MKKNKVVFYRVFGALLFGCFIFAGCKIDDNSSDSGDSGNSSGSGGTASGSAETATTATSEITSFNSSDKINITSWANSYSPNSSSRDITTDAAAYESVSFNRTLYVDLSMLQVSADNSTWTSLSDGGESATVTLDSVQITANISDGVLYIDSSSFKSNLKFDITGTAEKGALNISSYKKGTVALYLHDAAISSSGNYPCINVAAKSTVYLVLEGTNSLTDGRSFGTGYSEAEGTDYYTSSFSGTKADGAELTANWVKGDKTKGSIYTKGSLLISGSGSLTLNEGYKHGIYSKDYIRVFGGKLNVNTTGRNAIQSVNGFVMDDGEITISGTGANTNNQSRGIIVEGAEDTDNPGEGFIVINGGNIYAYSSSNDAIDSNGTLTINGGVIVALTAKTPECAFDCDDNTFEITGGLLVGVGTSNYSKPTSSACMQSTVVLSGNYFGAGGTTFAVEDSTGNAAFAFTVPTAFGTSASSQYIMILSSPEIKTGSTYKAVSGVTASGGSTFNNLYVELPSVSGGSTTASGITTTTSSYVYTKTSGTTGGSTEGSHPNPGPGGR